MIATGPRRSRPRRLPARRWARRCSTPTAMDSLTPAHMRCDSCAPAEGAQAGASEGADPVDNAVAVARFSDGSFGWGVREAGHGLVFLNSARSLDAPAAAPLSSHGDYGPLLLLAQGASLPPPLAR